MMKKLVDTPYRDYVTYLDDSCVVCKLCGPSCKLHNTKRSIGGHFGFHHKDIANKLHKSSKFTIKCLECNQLVANSKNVLGRHVRKIHKMPFEDYEIKWVYNGERPSCKTCGKPLKRRKGGFPRFCSIRCGSLDSAKKRQTPKKNNIKHDCISDVSPSAKIMKSAKASFVKKAKDEAKTTFIEKCVAAEENEALTQESGALQGDTNPIAYGGTKLLKWNENELSSKYISEISLAEKEKIAKALFCFYRSNGFPYIVHSKKTLLREWEKLQKESLIPKEEGGEIILPNKRTAGNKLTQHFNSKQFYSVKSSDRKSLSMIEAFHDDELLMKVIRNRLNITYKETFNIHGAMIRQGFRSTRTAAVTSTFNCLVAKYIYTNLAPENGLVFDYSAGFGHRMLGALASPKNLKYVACDPWTEVVENNKSMAEFIGCRDRVKIWNYGSEMWQPPAPLLRNVDLAFSSPPYYNKEIYDNGKNGQAYENKTFEQFIDEWWVPTVETIKALLKPGGYLAINMVEPMINDLLEVANNLGFKEIKRYHLQMSRSHFEKAKKLGNKIKGKFKAEPIVVLEKKQCG